MVEQDRIDLVHRALSCELQYPARDGTGVHIGPADDRRVVLRLQSEVSGSVCLEVNVSTVGFVRGQAFVVHLVAHKPALLSIEAKGLKSIRVTRDATAGCLEDTLVGHVQLSVAEFAEGLSLTEDLLIEEIFPDGFEDEDEGLDEDDLKLEDTPRCPWCGYVDRDEYSMIPDFDPSEDGVDFYNDETGCSSCGQEFYVERHITYSTRKKQLQVFECGIDGVTLWVSAYNPNEAWKLLYDYQRAGRRVGASFIACLDFCVRGLSDLMAQKTSVIKDGKRVSLLEIARKEGPGVIAGADLADDGGQDALG